MTAPNELAVLLDIAQRAINLDGLSTEYRVRWADLNAVYLAHKQDNGLERVERGTLEWDAIMAATKAEYGHAQTAKQAEYNAKRRLQTAIRNYRTKVRA